MEKLSDVPFDKIYVGMPVVYKEYKGVVSHKYNLPEDVHGHKQITIEMIVLSEKYAHHGRWTGCHSHFYDIYLDPTRM